MAHPFERDEMSGGTALGAEAVLVPLDGSEHALAALPVARWIARAANACLHVLHIAERALPPRDLLHKLALDPEDVHGSIIDQEEGEPAEAIVRMAEEQGSPFIVLCTHTGQREPAGELGGVALDVIRAARCPVVLVPPFRGREDWSPGRILFPYDGTPDTAAAACPALEFARAVAEEMIVLHATAPGIAPPDEPGSITAPLYVDQAQHEWPAWGREFLDRACWSEGWTGRLRVHLSVGEPGVETARFARERRTDLIVVAWHGTWEGHAAAVKAVIRDAPCPIMVLRA